MHSENLLPNTHYIVTFPKMSKIPYSCGLSKGICNIHRGSKPSEQTQWILSLIDPILLFIEAKASPACSLAKTGLPTFCPSLHFLLMYCNMIKPSFIYSYSIVGYVTLMNLFQIWIAAFRNLDSWAAKVRKELQSWLI